jgi:hypothetical protein
MEVKINNTTNTRSLIIFSNTRLTMRFIGIFSYVYQDRMLENIIIIP